MIRKDTGNTAAFRSCPSTINEDDLQDTILPRFDLAGGCDMFFHPITGVQVSKDDKTRQRMIALKEDIGLLCVVARKLAPHLGLIVID